MNGNLFTPSAPETSEEWLVAHCDGGSRGNPGPAGYGAVIEDSKGRKLTELSEFLGIQTNNFAEYSGMLAVLRWAIENQTQRLRIISDSELMVKQIQGKYKVASPVLKPLYDEARRLVRQIPNFEIRHTLRGGNKEADRLANGAMDRGMGRAPGSAAPAAPSARPAAASSGPRPAAGAPASRPQPSRPAMPAVRPPTSVLEGYVKNGVVHFLGGSLPDGVFVKIIHE